MELLGNEVEVVIERKKIKNIYFRITEDKKILVICHKLVPKFEIDALLKKNKKSLEKMYLKSMNKNKELENIYFLGKKLDYINYKKIMLDENHAYGPSIEKVNEYLEKNSLPYFQKRLDKYINDFDNLPSFRLRTRKMKTRWGVCNISSMTVTLNTLLIHKDIDLIDYVICHELSHFSHMDHSASFWKEVEKHYPNYKEARRRLKD